MGCGSSKDVVVDMRGPKTLEHFSVERIVGKGGMGTVNAVTMRKFVEGSDGKGRLCKKSKDLKWFAMKSIDKYNIVKNKSYRAVFRERRLLAHVRHDFICNVHYCFQDESKLYMVMDLLLGGDLRYQLAHWNGGKPMSEALTKFYIAQIALALGYLHDKDVIHRDVKPDNVLMDEKGYVKLTDFGIAYELDVNGWCTRTSGTAGYMAPEMYTAKHGKEVDWFALGVMLVELIVNERPFKSDELKKGKVNFRETVRTKLTKFSHGGACMNIAKQLVEKETKMRLGSRGVDSVKSHAWFAADEGFSWDAIEDRTAIPPFIPNTKTANFEASHELLNVFIGDEEKSPALTENQQKNFNGFEFDIEEVRTGRGTGHFVGSLRTETSPRVARMMSLDHISLDDNSDKDVLSNIKLESKGSAASLKTNITYSTINPIGEEVEPPEVPNAFGSNEGSSERLSLG